MNKATVVFALVIGVVILISSQSFASDQFWYDQEKQAIAVDTYANGFGTKIEIDFNPDHSANGLIGQALWDWEHGNVTELGLQNRFYYQWGYVTHYGWGERLGAAYPAYDYSSQVTKLWSGILSPDGYHYFTPEWDVSNGSTVIYIRPVVDSMSIPVTVEDLNNFYFRIKRGDWLQLSGSVPPSPEPEPKPDPKPCPDPEAEIVDVELMLSPNVLNSKSKGQWVIAKIELPGSYRASDLDLDSVMLAINADIIEGDELVESVSIVSKVSEAGKDGSRLIAKFDRRLLIDLLPSGESGVYVHGKLYDGSSIKGIATLWLNH